MLLGAIIWEAGGGLVSWMWAECRREASELAALVDMHEHNLIEVFLWERRCI